VRPDVISVREDDDVGDVEGSVETDVRPGRNRRESQMSKQTHQK